MRPGAPGNQGQSLFCSVTMAVGLPSSDLPHSPRWYGGLEKGVSTELLAGPWVHGDTDLLSEVNLAPPLLREMPF